MYYGGSSWPCGQGGGLAIVGSPVLTPPPRAYGGALVAWPGMPFPNLDGRIHQSLVFSFSMYIQIYIFTNMYVHATYHYETSRTWIYMFMNS
jgi:hypothetical protein